MKLTILKSYALFALVVLTACTVLHPKPLPERINDAYIVVTAVATEITEGVQDGYYTKDEARGYVNSLVKAKDDLDSADSFIKLGDLTTAEGKMKLVDTAISGVRSWLAKQRSTPR